MTPSWNNPDHDPVPPQWSARDDSELDSLARLYRDHPPPEPNWGPTLAGIESRLARDLPPNRRWRIHLVVGLLTTAAAIFGGLVLARPLWQSAVKDNVDRSQTPVAQVAVEDDEPYPVALASEVNIIAMDPKDADRIVMGVSLLGSFELVDPEDIEIVHVEPHPDAGWTPRPQQRKGAPMIIVARADDDDDDP